MSSVFLSFLCCLLLSGVAWTEDVIPRKSDMTSPVGFNATEKHILLATINAWRGRVTPPAADMNTLVWDEELATMAQAQADTCSFDYGFPDWADDVNITKTLPERNVGQTIWRGWNVSFATNYWNGEGEWYDYCNNRCTYDRKALKALGFYRSSKVYYYRGCFNYTQLIWGDSQYVGCGHRVCDWRNKHYDPGKDSLVCNYFPGKIEVESESTRMKRLPYKTREPLDVACARGAPSGRAATNLIVFAMLLFVCSVYGRILP